MMAFFTTDRPPYMPCFSIVHSRVMHCRVLPRPMSSLQRERTEVNPHAYICMGIQVVAITVSMAMRSEIEGVPYLSNKLMH